ncbi:MAG: rRNA methyltransferase, partial [Catalinimonas sp.]
MLNLPPAFVARMQARLGTDHAAFLDSLTAPPPVSLRLQPDKIAPPAGLVPVPWSVAGRYLPTRPAFALDPWWHGGAYYVQEASSQMLEAALGKVVGGPPGRVLDLCGAPGGKATHVAALLPPGGLLVTNEVI